MGHYRARDLLKVPSLISLLRLPLAAGFVLFVSRPLAALAVLALAGLSDVVDGWYARRYRQATATGAVVDGFTDKLFAAAVVVALVGHRSFEWHEAVLLATREVLELPLLVWWMLHRKRRRAKAEDPKANRLGKAVTVLQFAAVSSALFHQPLRFVLLYAVAGLGFVAAVMYWKREIEAVRA